jgi:hypothetical protein
MITERANYLLFERITRDLIEVAKGLPGRKRWKDGKLYVETGSANIAHLLRHMPQLSDLNLPSIRSHLGAETQLSESTVRKSSPDAFADALFKTKPFPHQLEALGASWDSEFFGLFMEMGTGKTKIIIDNIALLHRERGLDGAIVFTLDGVHHQWVDSEIPIHMPEDVDWAAWSYTSSRNTKWKAAVLESAAPMQILTVPLEALSSDKCRLFVEAFLSSRTRCMGIVDESHKIKNPSAKRSKYIQSLARKFKYRRIATGTDVTQGVQDLFSQMLFLHPNILGHKTFTGFRAEFCEVEPIYGAPRGAVKIVGYKNMDRLLGRVGSAVYRARKKDCLDLPEKTYQQISVPMSAEQARIYGELLSDMSTKINGTEINAPLAISLLSKLQQVTSGHIRDEQGAVHYIPSRKLEALIEKTHEVSGGIIWARFVPDIELLQSALQAEGYRVGTYYGATPEDERRRVTTAGEVDWLVANPASAGTGVNLTHWSTAFYYSNSFSAADRWQSEDRIHRIGQPNQCLYVDFLSEGTVDEGVFHALRRKEAIAEMVRDPRYFLELARPSGAKERS